MSRVQSTQCPQLAPESGQGWTVAPLRGDFERYAQTWDRLNLDQLGDHPLQRSYQIAGYLHYFGQGIEYLCTLWRDGQPMTMLILRRSGFYIWSSFVPAQAQIAPIAGRRLEGLTPLLRALPGFVGELDLLCIDDKVTELGQHNEPPSHALPHALTMCVELQGGFEAYWNERPKKLRSNIKRYEGRLQSSDIKPRFLAITDPQALRAAVRRYAELESQGWKGRQGTALEANNLQHQFFEEVLVTAGAQGQATIYELWFNNQLAASRMLVSSAGMAVMLKTTFDESLSQFSPGRLLLKYSIESRFKSHPGQTIEFYTDATPDQLAWATGQRQIYHHMIFRNPAMRIAYNTGRLVMHGIRSFVPRRAKSPTGDAIELIPHPQQFPADLRAMLAAHEQKDMEFGIDWFQNLVDSVFGDASGVAFYVLRSKGKPLAVLPLLIAKEGSALQAGGLTNFYTSIYEPIFDASLSAAQLGQFFRAILKRHPKVAQWRFAPMDTDSAVYALLQEGLRLAGQHPFTFYGFGNWYLPVSEDWQVYLKSRSSTLRSTIRRMEKRFAGDGGSLELVSTSEGLDRAIADYESVYAASWKRQEPYPEFMPGLMRLCAANGWLRLGIAKLNDQPIAAQLWIVSHSKAKIYKVAYREEYKSYSIGTLVSAMLMQHVLDTDKVAEVDFLVGDDPYKQTWMSHRRERWGIIAYNPRSIYGAYGLIRETVWRQVKPLVVKLWRRIADTKSKSK